MKLNDLTLGLIIYAVMFVAGIGTGWYLKGERAEKQTQTALSKEHNQSVQLGAQHAQRQAEVDHGIRSAGTHLRDCDRADANADILATLDRYPRRSGAK